MFAVIEPGSCFAGTLLELALAADRSYMLTAPDTRGAAGAPSVAGELRLATRPWRRRAGSSPAFTEMSRQLRERAPPSVGRLHTQDALDLGLVTAAPDALDWDDEIRIALEERSSLSPDALTGMEANLRFGPAETLETRIFGRLSAWQNWIFIRPNAVGEAGALKVFGTGNKARFNWERV